MPDPRSCRNVPIGSVVSRILNELCRLGKTVIARPLCIGSSVLPRLKSMCPNA